MSNLRDQIEELLCDHQHFHSSLQIDHFIVSASGKTLYGMYRQALRELEGRYKAIRQRYLKKHRLERHIEKLSKLEDQDLVRIGKELDLEDLERVIEDSERELVRFFLHAKRLKAELGPLTPAKRVEMEQVYWATEFRSQIAVSLLSGNGVPRGVIEYLPHLPIPLREVIINSISNPGEVQEWYLNYYPSPPSLPSHVALPPNFDLERLLEHADSGSTPASG